MARRNRKRRRMNSFVFPAPFAGLMILVSVLALGYVWLGCRCDSLGREIKNLEKEKDLLTRKYLTEEYQWTRLKSPRQIERALQIHHITMTWPRNDQIIRVNGVNGSRNRVAGTEETLKKYAGPERIVMNE